MTKRPVLAPLTPAAQAAETPVGEDVAVRVCGQGGSMISDNTVARVVDGQITHWPYKLRPDAKRLYPNVSPLPGSWDQVAEQGLLESLDAQLVMLKARPYEPPGYDVVEVSPQFEDGQLVQCWELVGEVPVPSQPVDIMEDFTVETLPSPASSKYVLAVAINTKRGKCPVWCDGKHWLYMSDNSKVK